MLRLPGSAPLNGVKLSVVIPLYNEEENVAPLVEEVGAALEGQDFELVLVDDGSGDATVSRVPLDHEKIAVRLKNAFPAKKGCIHAAKQCRVAGLNMGVAEKQRRPVGGFDDWHIAAKCNRFGTRPPAASGPSPESCFTPPSSANEKCT